MQPPTVDVALAQPVARSRRVVVLLLAVALLSLADLVLTLTCLTTAGLSESNPIARMVIGASPPWFLAVWKIASIIAACGILYLHRERRQAEIGAWICLAVLVWLSFRWSAYLGTFEFISVSDASALATDPEWVTMTR